MTRALTFWETDSYSSDSVVWESAGACPSLGSFSGGDQVTALFPTGKELEWVSDEHRLIDNHLGTQFTLSSPFRPKFHLQMTLKQ